MKAISKLVLPLAAAGLASWMFANGPATAPADKVTTVSGLTILQLSKSDGGARNGDQLWVHYAGRLESGAEFDNSYKSGKPIALTLGAGRVIKGWEEGLVGMTVGEKRQLIIPPELGYGSQDRKDENGQVVIPANSMLIFDVELMGILRR